MKHRKARIIASWTIIALMILSIIGGTIGVTYIQNIANQSPELNPEDFTAAQSSKIFDSEGNIIANIGLQIRENIEYDDLPQSVVDAFVAIEDSRFFEHNGFDIPRFTKAIFENLKTMSFSQGGSTFTMQLVKGTYFETEEATAVRSGLAGVNRKIQEIKVALQAENVISKKEILTFYLNKINYGVPKNRRGIQTAAQYYFGKDISEVSLLEAAVLAGVINAPNLYSPINNLELSEKRAHTVLDLMVYHGYITESEAELAKSVPLENLLVGELSSNSANIAHQAYVDAVIAEVIEITGQNPVSVPMRIYTAMDTTLQNKFEQIQNGEDESVLWPNDIIQTAMVTLDNKTGQILAIGGGRFYEGERLFNRVTDMKRQPGSSAKLILTYPLAFEELGWSTAHTLEDKPIRYEGVKDVIIKNFDGVYRGNVSIEYAVGVSLNIPAIETMDAVVSEMGIAKVVTYLNNLGFDNVNNNNFDLGFGIGGSNFTASPLQMAGAYRAMLSAGEYVTPHTVLKIEFIDGSDDFVPEYTAKEVLSEDAAYITASLMANNVSGPYRNFMQILQRGYEVYAKTGTSDWGETGVEYGIPAGSAKDKWMIAGTSEFTTAVWVGYDKAEANQISHITQSVINMNLPGKINNSILKTLYEDRPNPANIARPNGVSDIRIVKNIYPYIAPSPYASSDLIVSGLIKKEFANISEASYPIAINLPLSISNGEVVAGQLTGYEPYGGYLMYELVAGPSHGNLDIFDPYTGYFQYTHYGDSENDSFTFRVNNGSASNTARVSIALKNPKSE
ncbi:MAG TPA: transglycosylase domain-containing protein [Erysipelotrichaceae bacterium]|nr:transglycosylase domain-containing protein [Erysipelotrichaceae bacterium]